MMKLNTGAAVPLVFIHRCLDKLQKESTLSLPWDNLQYEVRWVVQFLFQEYTSRDLRRQLSSKDFCWGLEPSTLCRLKKVLVEA